MWSCTWGVGGTVGSMTLPRPLKLLLGGPCTLLWVLRMGQLVLEGAWLAPLPTAVVIVEGRVAPSVPEQDLLGRRACSGSV